MVSAQSSCKERYNHLVQPPCSGWSWGLGEVLTVTHRLNGTLQNRKACKNHHTFISVYAWQAPGAASERHGLLISNFPCWAGLSVWQLFSVCLLDWWPGGSVHAGWAQMSGFKVTGMSSPFLPLSSFQQMPLPIPREYSLLFTSHAFSLPLTHLGRLSPVPRSHARRRKEGARTPQSTHRVPGAALGAHFVCIQFNSHTSPMGGRGTVPCYWGSELSNLPKASQQVAQLP